MLMKRKLGTGLERRQPLCGECTSPAEKRSVSVNAAHSHMQMAIKLQVQTSLRTQAMITKIL